MSLSFIAWKLKQVLDETLPDLLFFTFNFFFGGGGGIELLDFNVHVRNSGLRHTQNLFLQKCLQNLWSYFSVGFNVIHICIIVLAKSLKTEQKLKSHFYYFIYSALTQTYLTGGGKGVKQRRKG